MPLAVFTSLFKVCMSWYLSPTPQQLCNILCSSGRLLGSAGFAYTVSAPIFNLARPAPIHCWSNLFCMKVTELELTSCFLKVCFVSGGLCCGSWTGAYLDTLQGPSCCLPRSATWSYSACCGLDLAGKDCSLSCTPTAGFFGQLDSLQYISQPLSSGRRLFGRPWHSSSAGQQHRILTFEALHSLLRSIGNCFSDCCWQRPHAGSWLHDAKGIEYRGCHLLLCILASQDRSRGNLLVQWSHSSPPGQHRQPAEHHWGTACRLTLPCFV